MKFALKWNLRNAGIGYCIIIMLKYSNNDYFCSVIYTMIRQYIAVLMLAVAFFASAQHDSSRLSEPADLVPVVSVTDTVPQKHGVIHRVLEYFKDSNKPKEYKRFDFSVIGGPHYSSDTKFGIGIVAAGFYRPNMADSLTMPSNVSLYGDISSVGFYLIGIRGNHIFRNDSRRINYNLYFYSFPRKFWGIGYDNGIDMDNASKFNELYIHANVDMMWRLMRNFYIGPAAEFAHVRANKVLRPELWQGQDYSTFTTGVGLKVQYDTRDNLTATRHGCLLMLEQRFCPRFMGNDYAFSYTSFQANWFKNVWKGGVIAANYHTRISYGNVPWSMMSSFGGSNNMRGYYEARFRDKCEMDIALELRQHVWRRNGIVVWAGAATVAPKISRFRSRHILPNAGIGYRWEFKHLTNVRLDFGVGKGETSFIFSINEAF